MKTRHMVSVILSFSAFLFILAGWNNASADFLHSQTQSSILFVKPGAGGGCTSWGDACDLTRAQELAITGDQIWVAMGTYYPTTEESDPRTATFQLFSGVAIYGGFDGTESMLEQRAWEINITTLSGDIGTPDDSADNSYHVVTGNGTNDTAILDGFTITAGNADGDWADLNDSGGGVHNYVGSPTLANLTISGNSGYYGGGIFNGFGSNPSLTNVTFSGNSADYGGGMSNGIYGHPSNPVLTDVTFLNNTANQYGGGMYNEYSSSPSLTDVTFLGNSSLDVGGGLANYDNCSPILTNVNFLYNTAVNYGGGMYNYESSPTLTQITFSDNTTSGAYTLGGGMCNYYESSPTLTDVSFSYNTADYGGGIYNYSNSNPTLTNVNFSDNSADYGGGMYNDTSCSPSLTQVSFSSNSADYGGGIYNYRSNSVLADVTFFENTAEYGGGMSNSESVPDLDNVTFSGNSADNGGGIYNYESNASLTNVTFSSNSAIYEGGGMYNSLSSPVLNAVTFTLNTAGESGGGAMYSRGEISDPANPSLTNAIVWGNTGGQIVDDTNSSTIITFSDIQGVWTGVGNIDQDPLLGPLANNGGFTLTHALGENSPAIDVGDPGNCPATDQRGYPRPIDGDGDGNSRCDMGAYEYGSMFFCYLPLILK